MADNVEQCRVALQESPSGDPRRPLSLSILGNSLRARFKRKGVLSDLDEAIEHYRAALELCPPGHSDISKFLSNLALCLRDRLKQGDGLSDLDESVELHRSALLLRPPGHPDRSTSLSNLAISLQDRSQQRGVLSELCEAIELHRAALLLRPIGHIDRPTSLNNLANCLRDLFQQRGVLSNLDEAIELHRSALLLRAPGHTHRYRSLNNLANCLRDRFAQQGILSDMDEAIELHRVALTLCSPDDSFQSGSLNNLAISLQTRFEQRGTLPDLDEAIELYRAALVLCPLNHSYRPWSLSNLAASLRVRFAQRGFMPDVDEAIELARAALALCPTGHSYRSLSLNTLASSLQTRFEQQGVLSDLDEAIELNRAALLHCPPGHADRSASLNDLATSLAARFDQRGVLCDLDEAIELVRAALLLCPLGHPDRFMSLNNLASGLQTRFEQKRVLSDLDEAMELLRAALALCPPGHSDRPGSLNNLASNLHVRFEKQGVLSDLDEAIELARAALVLYPPGHSDRFTSLNNLASILHSRPEQQHGVSSDLDESIELRQAALASCPPGHSHRSACLNSLAISLRKRFDQQGIPSDLDEAFGLYLQLPEVSHAASRTDLDAAKSWVTSAEQLKHGSALFAYQTSLKFLVENVTLLSSSSRHFDVIREATSSLAMDGFSCGIRHGALMTAVELVEQGRAVFWTQLARFRTPLDELSASGNTGKALAEEVKQLSFRLHNMFDASIGDQSQHIRQLTIQWDEVISRIRMLPDFSRFLLPPLFSDLQRAAEHGPIIIVNASKYSCDALIVLNTRDPVLVPLDITQAEVFGLSSEFQSLTMGVGSSDHRLELHKIVSVLRKLWGRIVWPVVQALREFIHTGSRIWWCPTADFTLLPLHAAGPYEKKSHNLSHFYVSSYTPTLAALIRARQQVSQDASIQHFIAVGQANPAGGNELRSVPAELAVVAQRVAPMLPFTSLADSDATVQGILDALSQNQWLHLACHGMPNRKQPFESSFAMREGPLTIRDIIGSRLQNPEFAFLSACHTTVGDELSPDEAIHLAAAMQFSGFRSVIGSMWSVDDDVARQIVSTFYDNLVDGSGRLDCTRAAVALHKAVKILRKKIPLEQQIVFIHIGV